MMQSILDFLGAQQQPQEAQQSAPMGMPQGLVQQILSSRFQGGEPTADDVGSAALAGVAGDTYVNPQSYADKRLGDAMTQLHTIAALQKLAQGPESPSAVREYEYFNKLPPDQQQNFLNVKRAQQQLNLGDRIGILDPTTGGIRSSFDKGLPPSDQPTNAFNKSQASESGQKGVELQYAAPLAAANISGKGEITPIEQKQMGQNQVDKVVSDISSYYDALDTAGAAVNTANAPGKNFANYIANSDVGQVGGKMFGTDNQSIRNQINQAIPSLINSIRQTTGMSAKAMDSNAELKFYLQQATDPTLDITANKAALARIQNMYGAGAGIKPQNGQTQPVNLIPGNPNADPRVQKAIDAGYSPEEIQQYLSRGQ